MRPFYWQKLLEDIISIKFFVLILSSLFLLVAKITPDNWVMVALGITGLHTADAMTSTFKGVPPVIPRRSQIDNPDA